MTLASLPSLGRAKEAGGESWATAPCFCGPAPVSDRWGWGPEEATGMGMAVGSEVRV